MAKDKGFEYLDDSPVEVPVKLRRKDSWAEMVQHVAAELSRRASQEGDESFEDSLDFGDEDDDDLPISPSETRYLKEEELLTEALEAARIRTARYRAAQIQKEMNRGKKHEPERRGDDAGESRSDDAVQESKKKGG